VGRAPIELPFGVMTLVELLRQRAQHQPEQPLYTFCGQQADAEAQLTVGALDRQARRIGGHLQQMGQPGQRVLLCYPPGLDYIAAFFGCLYANMIAVPTYLPPSNRPAPRLQAILADAQPALALSTSATLANLRYQLDTMPQLGALRWLCTDELPPHVDDDWQPPRITNTTLAFLQYTSGSTATPKGVMLTHANLLHNLAQIYHFFGHSPASRGVIWLPPYHDMGLIGGILQPLYGGFPVTLLAPLAFLQRPLRWLETIARTGATTSGGPNFAYDLCVRKSTPEQRAALDLSRWTVAFSGAEPVRAATIQRFAEAFACAGFRREAFYPCYGLAEATLIVTGGQVAAAPTTRSFDRDALARHRALEAGTAASQALVACGAPLPAFEQQIAIVQAETGRRCEPGAIGEIWVSGPSVARGYWKRPDETARTFAAYLTETEEGPFLRTGDLGFVHDGELFITGRLKELIIIHGRNYYPHDLETIAEQSHIALQPNGSAAFGVEIDGEERLVIVHEVQRQHRSASIDELAAAVRRAVAEQYEAQVYAVVLIKPGSLPRTSSGKIQRYLCRAQFMSRSLPVLAESTLAASEASDLPEEPLPLLAALKALDPAECARRLELYLVGRIARLLGVAASMLDPAQPPSAFGLDSLAAVELQHALERDLGLVLPMAQVLETPSIAALAQTLAAEIRSADRIDQPGVEAGPAESYPLSYGQRALWFLQQVAPESPAYTIARAMRIGAATIDSAALRHAFQALVDRHPALRTIFSQQESQQRGALTQQVQPTMPVAFYEENSSGWSEAALLARLAEESRRPFDLSQGPLLRVYLFRREPGAAILLLTVHHIVADGWSLTLLLRELELLYAGQPAPLNASSATYADYVRWQMDLLAGSRGAALWHYWQQQLADTVPVLDLPLDHPRPPVQTYAGATRRFRLNRELLQQLKALAASENTTLFTLCLAAFQALLYRYTGQAQILVGSPTAGRSRASFAGTIGYFVNPVPLRADLAAELRFIDLLRQARQRVLDALAHHQYPFPLLVERLSPDRDLSRSPLFQVLFGLEKNPWLEPDQRTAGLRLEPIEMEQPAVQFDLELMLLEDAASLDGALHYNTDLFEPDTIARLAEHYRTLLQEIVAQPEQPLGQVPLLTPAEQQLLHRWNETALTIDHERCVHELFAAQAARTPDALAVIGADRSLSYRELSRRVNQLAHYLQQLGVGPEVRVAVCLDRSPDLLVALLAVLQAGGCYLPLDPSYPAERLKLVLQDADVALVLTQAQIPLPPVAPRLCLDADWPRIAQQPEYPPTSAVTPANLAYLIATSGSTGRPKAVLLPHRALTNFLCAMQRQPGLSPTSTLLAVTTVAFDIAALELFLPLLVGCPHPVLQATPATWRLLLASGWTGTPTLTALCGGEALPRELANQLRARVGALWNLYGPTETTVWSTAGRVPPGAGPVPLGAPIANTQLYVLDRAFQPVPLGVWGELLIGGAGVARGYHGRPDLTAERFVPDPFSAQPGGRLYRTGDLVRYRADGTLEFGGRIDQQVKLRGFRIELGEIEHALGSHPQVREAAVILREDTPGDPRLVAYVTGEQGSKGTKEQANQVLGSGELRQFLAQHLPEYMLPSAVVVLPALPRTPNGKLDRRALHNDATPVLGPQNSYAAPGTPDEELLAEIWSDVLRRERIGVHDNFFALGGHSLLATQLIARIHSAYQVELNLSSIFEAPTIAQMALIIEDLLLEKLAALSDDEVQRLTAAMLTPADRPAV
jgi:non-ribosomal peptide synthetase component F/acyl carrier protein